MKRILWLMPRQRVNLKLNKEHLDQVMDSILRWVRLRSIKRSIRVLMRSQILKFRSSLIGGMFLAMTLRALSEIRGLVVLVIQWLSQVWWNQDWGWSMEKMWSSYRHNFFWIAITSQKDVREVGLTSMLTLLRMVTWLVKNALLIKDWRRVSTALNLKTVHLSPKFLSLTM